MVMAKSNATAVDAPFYPREFKFGDTLYRNTSPYRALPPSPPQADSTCPWSSNDVRRAFPVTHAFIGASFPEGVTPLLRWLSESYGCAYYGNPLIPDELHLVTEDRWQGRALKFVEDFIRPLLQGRASYADAEPALLHTFGRHGTVQAVGAISGSDADIPWRGRLVRILPAAQPAWLRSENAGADEQPGFVATRFKAAETNWDRIVEESHAFARYLFELSNIEPVRYVKPRASDYLKQKKEEAEDEDDENEEG